MIPTLFELGPIKIRSYGVMLSIAFICAWYVVRLGVRRRKWPDDLAYDIIALSAIFGIIGSKVFHIVDHWDSVKDELLKTVFSGSGLTFLGGPIVAAPVVLYYMKRKGYSALHTLDVTAPAIAIGAAVGRLGCLVAGDGCYGIPTDLPWGMTFPNGIVPTQVPVHPTPLYESLWHGTLALALVAYDRRTGAGHPPGRMFAAWLVVYGIGRFLVEFIRNNPRYEWHLTRSLSFSLTQSQFISLVMLVGGAIWLVALAMKRSPGAGAGGKETTPATA